MFPCRGEPPADLDHIIPYLNPTEADRPAKPESATSDPIPAATTALQNPRRLAGPPTRTRHLALAITPTTGSTWSTRAAPTLGDTAYAQMIWRATSPPQQLASRQLPSP